jgi:hypothetical protein
MALQLEGHERPAVFLRGARHVDGLHHHAAPVEADPDRPGPQAARAELRGEPRGQGLVGSEAKILRLSALADGRDGDVLVLDHQAHARPLHRVSPVRQASTASPSALRVSAGPLAGCGERRCTTATMRIGRPSAARPSASMRNVLLLAPSPIPAKRGGTTV